MRQLTALELARQQLCLIKIGSTPLAEEIDGEQVVILVFVAGLAAQDEVVAEIDLVRSELVSV